MSFRARSQAEIERDLMAAMPEWAGHHVTAVYKGRSKGWAWRACPECAAPDDPGAEPQA